MQETEIFEFLTEDLIVTEHLLAEDMLLPYALKKFLPDELLTEDMLIADFN